MVRRGKKYVLKAGSGLDLQKKKKQELEAKNDIPVEELASDGIGALKEGTATAADIATGNVPGAVWHGAKTLWNVGKGGYSIGKYLYDEHQRKKQLALLGRTYDQLWGDQAVDAVNAEQAQMDQLGYMRSQDLAGAMNRGVTNTAMLANGGYVPRYDLGGYGNGLAVTGAGAATTAAGLGAALYPEMDYETQRQLKLRRILGGVGAGIGATGMGLGIADMVRNYMSRGTNSLVNPTQPPPKVDNSLSGLKQTASTVNKVKPREMAPVDYSKYPEYPSPSNVYWQYQNDFENKWGWRPWMAPIDLNFPGHRTIPKGTHADRWGDYAEPIRIEGHYPIPHGKKREDYLNYRDPYDDGSDDPAQNRTPKRNTDEISDGQIETLGYNPAFGDQMRKERVRAAVNTFVSEKRTGSGPYDRLSITHKQDGIGHQDLDDYKQFLKDTGGKYAKYPKNPSLEDTREINGAFADWLVQNRGVVDVEARRKAHGVTRGFNRYAYADRDSDDEDGFTLNNLFPETEDLQLAKDEFGLQTMQDLGRQSVGWKTPSGEFIPPPKSYKLANGGYVPRYDLGGYGNGLAVTGAGAATTAAGLGAALYPEMDYETQRQLKLRRILGGVGAGVGVTGMGLGVADMIRNYRENNPPLVIEAHPAEPQRELSPDAIAHNRRVAERERQAERARLSNQQLITRMQHAREENDQLKATGSSGPLQLFPDEVQRLETEYTPPIIPPRPKRGRPGGLQLSKLQAMEWNASKDSPLRPGAYLPPVSRSSNFIDSDSSDSFANGGYSPRFEDGGSYVPGAVMTGVGGVLTAGGLTAALLKKRQEEEEENAIFRRVAGGITAGIGATGMGAGIKNLYDVYRDNQHIGAPKETPIVPEETPIVPEETPIDELKLFEEVAPPTPKPLPIAPPIVNLALPIVPPMIKPAGNKPIVPKKPTKDYGKDYYDQFPDWSQYKNFTDIFEEPYLSKMEYDPSNHGGWIAKEELQHPNYKPIPKGTHSNDFDQYRLPLKIPGHFPIPPGIPRKLYQTYRDPYYSDSGSDFDLSKYADQDQLDANRDTRIASVVKKFNADRRRGNGPYDRLSAVQKDENASHEDLQTFRDFRHSKYPANEADDMVLHPPDQDEEAFIEYLADVRGLDIETAELKGPNVTRGWVRKNDIDSDDENGFQLPRAFGYFNPEDNSDWEDSYFQDLDIAKNKFGLITKQMRGATGKAYGDSSDSFADGGEVRRYDDGGEVDPLNPYSAILKKRMPPFMPPEDATVGLSDQELSAMDAGGAVRRYNMNKFLYGGKAPRFWLGGSRDKNEQGAISAGSQKGNEFGSGRFDPNTWAPQKGGNWYQPSAGAQQHINDPHLGYNKTSNNYYSHPNITGGSWGPLDLIRSYKMSNFRNGPAGYVMGNMMPFLLSTAMPLVGNTLNTIEGIGSGNAFQTVMGINPLIAQLGNYATGSSVWDPSFNKFKDTFKGNLNQWTVPGIWQKRTGDIYSDMWNSYRALGLAAPLLFR